MWGMRRQEYGDGRHCESFRTVDDFGCRERACQRGIAERGTRVNFTSLLRLREGKSATVRVSEPIEFAPTPAGVRDARPW